LHYLISKTKKRIDHIGCCDLFFILKLENTHSVRHTHLNKKADSKNKTPSISWIKPKKKTHHTTNKRNPKTRKIIK